jgi:hypothetical protein
LVGRAAPVDLVTSNGGASWETVPGPQYGGSGRTIFDCLAASCIASSEHPEGPQLVKVAYFSVSTDGGLRWSISSRLTGAVVQSLSCPTAHDCVAVGHFDRNNGTYPPLAMYSPDGGANWHVASIPPELTRLSTSSQLTSVSCSGTRCVAVGETLDPRNGGEEAPMAPPVVLTSSDDGASWTLVRAPTGLGSLAEVDCSSSGSCVVAGYDNKRFFRALLAASSDFGATWTTGSLGPMVGSSQAGSIVSMACDGSSRCLLLAVPSLDKSTSHIYLAEDGGKRWTEQQAPSGFDLSSLACPAPTSCYAVGRDETLGVSPIGSIIVKGSLAGS